MKMRENEDYELIPGDGDAWHVRIKSGDFVEMVLEFGAISFNEVKDHLSFSFTIVSKPDIIITEDNEDLQFVCARILEDIIERGLEEGSVAMRDRKSGELIE